MTLSISPEGELLVPGTPHFYDRIGYRDADFDAGDYVVRNMGFISISRIHEDRIKLRLRPELVTDTAIEETCRFLSNQHFNEVELEYFSEDWTTEVWPNDPALLQRLLTLRPENEPAKEVPRFMSTPLHLEKTVEDYGNPLKPLFQKWRISSSSFDDTTLPFLMRFGYGSRLIIMAAPSGNDPLRFNFIGDGFKFYNESDMLKVIGERIDDQPDRAYGSWVAAHYYDVMRSQEPRLDYIDALITPAGAEARRSRYERLLLPWRSEGGSVIITCASILISKESETGANDNGKSGEPIGSRGFGPLRHEPLDIGKHFKRTNSN